MCGQNIMFRTGARCEDRHLLPLFPNVTMLAFIEQKARSVQEQHLLQRQVSFLWDSLPRDLLATAVVVALFWVPYATEKTFWALTWFSLLVGLGILDGAWMYRRWQHLVRSNSPWDPTWWGWRFTVGCGITMTFWGVTLAYFFQVSEGFLGMLTLITACLLAIGVVPHYASFFPALLAAAVPTMLPLITVLFWRMDQVSVALACGLIIVAFVCIGVGWNLRQTIRGAVSLAIENQGLIQELQAAQARKTRFFADANHDLRQPIHAIGLLVSELKRPLPESEKNEYVRRIESSIEGMQNLIDYLLDSAKLEAGAVTPKISVFPIAQTLRRVDSHFQPIARAKGIALHVRESDALVRSDPALLEQILRNLVGNAISYTPKGKVLVGTTRSGESLKLSVWDQGLGIPRDKIDAVFEAFVRLDGPNPGGKHVGLGLAIVKRCAELLQHPLSVDSRPNHGSRFSVSIPYAGKDTHSAATPVLPHVDVGGAFVAVVDDDDDILYAMQKMLNGLGCHVVTGRNGDEATEALAQHLRQPDLIICDLDLGYEETGVEVIERIRADQDAQIPALLVTGSQHKLTELMLDDATITPLLKPVPEQRLKTEISNALRESDRRSLALAQ